MKLLIELTRGEQNAYRRLELFRKWHRRHPDVAASPYANPKRQSFFKDASLLAEAVRRAGVARDKAKQRKAPK